VAGGGLVGEERRIEHQTQRGSGGEPSFDPLLSDTVLLTSPSTMPLHRRGAVRGFDVAEVWMTGSREELVARVRCC
jgi:hypothetical protein